MGGGAVEEVVEGEEEAGEEEGVNFLLRFSAKEMGVEVDGEGEGEEEEEEEARGCCFLDLLERRGV